MYVVLFLGSFNMQLGFSKVKISKIMSFECRSSCDGRLIKKLKNSNYRDTKSGHYKASI